MIIPYCLNIHPGESLEEIRSAITGYALRVKERLAPGQPYPLGLRFSAATVQEFAAPDTLELFQELLRYHNLYTTGINGFPYGTFHGTAVKNAVYQPDWTTVERVNYTMKLCSILAALLPDGMSGNVSTVPLAYKLDRTAAETHDLEDLFVKNMVKMAEFLQQLHQETGKRVALALEPEPDCVIENGGELIEWFNRFYAASAVTREYIGVCLDTCHFAVEFEDPLEVMQRLEHAGIRVERIQLSAALTTTISQKSINALKPFIDPVYLHQIKIKTFDGSIISLPDLTEDTLRDALQYPGCNLRTHFHVPLFYDGDNTLQSTNCDLTAEFFAHIIERQYRLEIETYTFDVLPPTIKPANLIDSLVLEHEWVSARLP